MLQPIFQSLAFLLSAILLLMVAAWWSAPRKDGRKPWGLIALRWTLLLMLACVLARPSCSQIETETYPGNVLILADASRSMEVADASDSTSKPGTASRFASMRKALADSAPELSGMARSVETEVFAFDQTVRPLTLKPNGKITFPKTSDGSETALGASLLEILRKSAGKKVLGVILLSDGAQRALPPQDALPQTAAQRLNRLGIPLFTVCFGSAGQKNQARDAAVEDFLVDQKVFVNTEVAVSGRVRLEGLAHQEVPVELLVEDASGQMVTADRAVLKPETANETLPVRLSWTPKEVGEVKAALRVPTQNEEVSDSNNQLDAFVTVMKSGLRVLCLEGAFRPETAFLRRSLDSAEEIQLEMIRLQGPGTTKKTGISAPETPSLLNLLQKEDYPVIILGDVRADSFSQAELELLAQKVTSGTGLLTLGGLQNYGPGGYASTPLAQILPVRMTPASSAPNTAKNSAPDATKNAVASHWNLPLRMKPTPAGRHHLALALDPDAAYSAQLWAKLPPLDGANRFPDLKPGAVILASDFTPENQEVPLLLEHSFGRGRVMTLAADSTWRWWLGGFEETHKRFWRQLIFWLANKETALDGTVSVLLPQRRFPQEQAIPFQVSARLSNGETPMPPKRNSASENWTVRLETPDGTQTELPLTPAGMLMNGKILAGMPEGDYMIHASVTHQGQKIGDSKCRFQIYHHDLELDHAQAEPELMEALALSTGGEAIQPQELSKLWKRLAENRQELKIERKIFLPLWDRWWWMALLLAALTLEWTLRKICGYV